MRTTYGSFQISIRIRSHRRSAAGHRRAGKGIPGRQPVRDFAGRHGIRQDVHHGQRHPGAEQAHAGHRAQQDAGGPALRRVQGIFPGKCGRIFRILVCRGREMRYI